MCLCACLIFDSFDVVLILFVQSLATNVCINPRLVLLAHLSFPFSNERELQLILKDNYINLETILIGFLIYTNDEKYINTI